jgi:hypothetical protein
MLSQKLLVDVSVDMFAGENRCVADTYRCFWSYSAVMDGRRAVRFK